jgi:radical SAM protein with 4Fe4S-binding SPASM domain
MRKHEQTFSAITTINSLNISQLEQLHEFLRQSGVWGWQLQIGLPMGTMQKNGELISTPADIDTVIDAAHKFMKKGGVDIQLADCIGYYNNKEIAVRKHSNKSDVYEWAGCGAGKYSFGILHNGQILGCTSIRDRKFIEGSIRDKTLKEIWNDKNSFLWNRQMTKDKLTGFCSECGFGSHCLGGCGNSRLVFGGDVHAENPYCSYHYALSEAKVTYQSISDTASLKNDYASCMKEQNFQVALVVMERLLELDPDNIGYLCDYGFLHFTLENYQKAVDVNKKILAMQPDYPYALKGLGLSLFKAGKKSKGISILKRACTFCDADFTDPLHDLIVILMENGNPTEAKGTYRDACKKFEKFSSKYPDLEMLISSAVN